MSCKSSYCVSNYIDVLLRFTLPIIFIIVNSYGFYISIEYYINEILQGDMLKLQNVLIVPYIYPFESLSPANFYVLFRVRIADVYHGRATKIVKARNLVKE